VTRGNAECSLALPAASLGALCASTTARYQTATSRPLRTPLVPFSKMGQVPRASAAAANRVRNGRRRGDALRPAVDVADPLLEVAIVAGGANRCRSTSLGNKSPLGNAVSGSRGKVSSLSEWRACPACAAQIEAASTASSASSGSVTAD
jgi:hypothetical protein